MAVDPMISRRSTSSTKFAIFPGATINRGDEHTLSFIVELALLFSYQSSTGVADPREMKLCPIHRTFLFLSDGWESVELYDDALFCRTYNLVSC
jgi:hypothetical protein